MLSSYRRLFAIPGARAFTGAGFVLRMPISMIGLGCVLLITRTGGSYAQAGAVSATFALVSAAVTPLLGRLTDRRGQATVLVGASVVEVVGMLVLVASTVGHAPGWTQFAAAAVIGAGHLPVGSMVRARWLHTTAEAGLRHTAQSWESVLDEVIFIVGPVLATLLCIRVAPAGGLLAAVALAVFGACWLVPQWSTEPPRLAAGSPPHPSAIRRPVVLGVTLVSVGLGALFGSVEVVVVAYTTERGQPGLAGAMLAVFAFGSMLAGLSAGAAQPATSLGRRLATATGVLATMVGTFPLLPGIAALTGAMFVAGLAVAPALICGFALLAAAVPAAAGPRRCPGCPPGRGSAWR